MIRVGLIGTGFGERVHGPAFRRHPEFSITSAVSPRDPSVWKKLVQSKEIDAVSIAVPPFLQPEIIAAALSAQKHVFCEKPLAANVKQTDLISTLLKKTNSAHVINFEFPEIAIWQQAKNLIQEGTVGRCKTVRVVWNTMGYKQIKDPSHWKYRRSQGGGFLLSYFSHTFYYLEWLMGPIARVKAVLTMKGDLDISNRIEGVFENGVTVQIEGSGVGSAPLHRLEIEGDKNTLVLENKTMDYMKGFTLKVGSDIIKQPDENPEDGRIAATAGTIGKFLTWIKTGNVQHPNLHDGLRVQNFLDKVDHA